MCRLNRHSPINHRSAHWKRRALAARPAQSDMYTLLREAWGLRASNNHCFNCSILVSLRFAQQSVLERHKKIHFHWIFYCA
jgi:hypothetical protein